MTKRSRNLRLAAAAGVLAVLTALLLWRNFSTAAGVSADATGKDAGALSAQSDGSGTGLSGRRGDRRSGTDETAAKDAEASDYLRGLFGQTIENKRTQIKALEKLINYLMKEYPNDWQAHLQSLLAQAFPGLADQLYAMYQNMTAYNDWLKGSRDQLAAMTHDERRDFLRDARFRYFGNDADEIWAESDRHEAIYDTMQAIDSSPDATVDEKLNTYLGAINENYGDAAPQFIEKRQTELMDTFLTLPSVQNDLHALSPEAREQQLDQIRAKMGLDEDARQRWRDLDSQRDQNWSAGEKYMQQRTDLASRYQGAQLDRLLDQLRKETFGAEAEIIQSEEQDGFFRFAHERQYGME